MMQSIIRISWNHLLVFIIIAVILHSVQSVSDGDIRLVGGLPYEGRIEIYHQSQWGTVCDDRFDKYDANVICRQLGYGDAEKVLHAGHEYGAGRGQIWMDGLECRGDEKRLADCRFNRWGIHDCSHSEDAAVVCKFTGPTHSNATGVRIACPGPDYGLGQCNECSVLSNSCNRTRTVIGVVERQVGDKWYPIPARHWDIKAARVVCRQLGYPDAGPIPHINVTFPRKRCGARRVRDPARCRAIQQFRARLSKTVTEGLSCGGSERNIGECFVASYNVNQTTGFQVAMIQCYHDRSSTEKCNSPNKELYRLRGGPTPWMGRVEVKRDGKWGTICDITFDIADANVICRNLGFGSAKKVFARSQFGRGPPIVHYSGLKCVGSEEDLSKCKSTSRDRLQGEVNSYCYQNTGDVGVECTVPACRKEVQSRLVGFQVEIKGHAGWGRLCFGAIDYNDAHVICRETSSKFAARFLPVRNSSYYGRSYIAEYECKGDELYTSECTKKLVLASCVNYTRLDCVTDLPDLVPQVERLEQSLKRYPYVSRTPMYYLTCALEENCLSSSAQRHANNFAHLRTLLRFDSLTMNYGTATFLPNLEPHQWQWHACHSHYHSFEAFINYDMLDYNGNKVSEGHKASFCLEDSFCASGGYSSFRCSTGRQGITVNCGDLYARHLDCQWIDITDLTPGNYILRLTVNKDRLVAESNYDNNYIQCHISYKGPYLVFETHNCTHSDH